MEEASTQISAEYNKLLLEISHITDYLPVNSATNKNINIVNSTIADSNVSLVDLYPLINNVE